MNKKEIIFVSSPYTYDHPDPIEREKVIRERVRKATLYCARLVAKGHTVISPVVYGQCLLDVHQMPSSFEFWQNFCFSLLEVSTKFHALCIDGVGKSEGMQSEINKAKELGIPVHLVEFEESVEGDIIPLNKF